MNDIVKFGDMAIDKGAGMVYLNGKAVNLTMTEYRMLLFMAGRRDEWTTVDDLIECLWDGCATHNSVWAVITRIRDKFGESAQHPRHIVQMNGRGYRLCADGRAR